MSRLYKWLIFLLGLAVMVIAIVSLVLGQQSSRSFDLRIVAQGLLCVEFVLVACSMFTQKRTRKNAMVVLLLAIVFAGVTVGTYLGHH
jgi:hypothetical protein